MSEIPRVVIVGGGFGGLNAAKVLGNAPVSVTIIDRRNYHLFQPLLYQVATGALSPGEISAPIRHVLRRYSNIEVLLAEMNDLDAEHRRVILRDGSELPYDILIVASGATHHYFGHDDWAKLAPGLKTIEDGTAMRRTILMAFEQAEREPDPKRKQEWLTFVIVGGGPTGVELAGALGEIANDTLRHDFRRIDPRAAHITLIEGEDRILPAFPPDLSAKAEKQLTGLGVRSRLKARVTAIDTEGVTVHVDGRDERIVTHTILWAAGVRASRLGKLLGERARAPLDKAGRVLVEPDLSVAGHPEIFVIGDLAIYLHQGGKPLPGLAAVAQQEGRYVGRLIRRRLRGQNPGPFRYIDKGTLATIGRNRAVAYFGKLHLSGFVAWFVWVFVHLMLLVGFQNRLLVLMEWVYNYITRNRGARLITNSQA